MSGFDTSGFVTGLGAAALAVLLVLAVTFVASRIAGKHSVIDTAWGLLFVAAAWASLLTAHGPGLQQWVLVTLVTLWGLRLATHIGRRTVGKPEDPRYEALLAKAPGNPTWYAIRTVYLLQGLLASVISAPVLVGLHSASQTTPLTWVGLVVWAVGVFFEAIGDWQLERFKADPAHRGRLITSGLWRYTRHPNYFGDACVWWGIYLVAAAHWPGVLTIFGPVLMTLLLTVGSGMRIMEKHMAGRPGWEEYRARTSAFVPLPPKRPDRAARRGAGGDQ